ncbi:DsbA family protein [Pedobacter endophyticus]|uniref:Thioredoxin domain-containing protein n=1 Tax=Pedobacter endophyticus TaxID=2789740 RepID=A0A7S9L1Z7_9SPHI|nr:thioredoxin domain-containing protein [Pedobacter endophyticus]QPH41025.1 thioredoxin domain-containing protein [Pedobacter endophyticus]
MSNLKPEVGSQDHAQGGKSAAITIVEFGDYQCPHCGNAHPILKEIEETFGDQVNFVFRNFPLQEIHELALPAAIAAEAAGLQGKYWEMHDALFDNQYRLSEDLFDELAETIGLDPEKFRSDSAADTVKEKIDNDFESGVRSGVNGTPSFYVNGTKFDGGATDLYQMLQESTK